MALAPVGEGNRGLRRFGRGLGRRPETAVPAAGTAVDRHSFHARPALDSSPTIRLAESEGFEPPSPCGLTVFKTAAFDRSANSPLEKPCYGRILDLVAMKAVATC